MKKKYQCWKDDTDTACLSTTQSQLGVTQGKKLTAPKNYFDHSHLQLEQT